jgi:uncharacterized repeat protein (TIGR01451 family)
VLETDVSPTHSRRQAGLCALLICVLSPLAAQGAFKATLHGVNAGGTTWIDGNLMGWRELDYIPCRVYFTGGPALNKSITIEFDHMRGTIPGVENLTGWTASPNVQITSPPVLSAPINAITWSYTFSVNVTNGEPGYVEFRARLSAGAHLNVGSSLALRGSPSLGTLQIHKPDAGAGFPDLAVLKRGPVNAGPGETITYTITYTNKPTSPNASLGVQVRDMLPAELDIITNSVSGGIIVGNSVIWDLGDLPIGAAGTITYRATVKPGVAHGTSFSNYAQILSSENDGNPADNASVVTTLVTFNRAPLASDDVYSVREDGVLEVPAPGVLANDTDADGNLLTVALPRPVSAPSHGVLIFNANGSFIYTPNADFNGVDTFTYYVTDGAATSAVAVVTITVRPVNDTPVAADDNYSTDEETPLTILAPGLLTNDTDADGDVLTAGLLAGPGHGTALLHANGSFTYTPHTNFHGTDSFTYRTSDGAAESGVATVTIIVRPVNDAPVANNDSYITEEDTALSVAVPGILSNDSDVDGSLLSATLVAGPGRGTVVLQPNGSFIYLPNTNFHGTDSFTYSAADGAAESAPATVTIIVRPVNDTPVAADDNYSTDEETPLTFLAPGLLTNDTDADGDVLTAGLLAGPRHGTALLHANGSFTYTPHTNFHGTDSFTYSAADGAAESSPATVTVIVRPINDTPVAEDDSYVTDEDMALTVFAPGILWNDRDEDSDALTARLLTNPVHGTVTVNPNGSFIYLPNTNFHGVDSFIYRASDGAAESGAAAVRISVRPIADAPMAMNDSYSTLEDVPLIVSAPGILVNDIDGDGDILTAALVSNPTNGTVTLNSDGSFIYTARADYNGPDSFSYRASDGALTSDVATVNIQVTPQPDPHRTVDDYFSMLEDGTLTVPAPGVLANDVSVDGDPLLAVITEPPQHGALTLNSDGGFTYVPAPDFNGRDSFSYRAAALAKDSLTSRVEIIVASVNDRPSFTIAPRLALPISSPLQTLVNWATDIRPGPADEGGQILTFELSTDQPTLFEVPPAISAGGTLTCKPMPGGHGRATVTVLLKDNGGVASGGIDTSLPQVFVISINAPPMANIIVPTNGSVFIASANIPILVEAADPDGVVTNLDLFAGTNRVFTAISSSYAFSWTNVPAGEYTLQGRATDNLGATGDSAPVAITVLERPPILLLGEIVLNRQSGLFEQRARVTNPTPLDYEAIRVLVTDLAPNVTVYNRSGITNGIPYVQPAASVPAGGSVDVIIEYYVPDRIPPHPTLRVELVQSSPPPGTPAGETVQMTRFLRLANGTFMIEWNSLLSRCYFIQYSDDMHTWKTVMPPAMGTGTRQQWIDNGPPKTDAFPAERICRFYRLILAQ